MNFAIAIALLVLFGLLTLSSYVERVYAEVGKFLSREFQENIDYFEQQVEPKLKVSRVARRSVDGDPDPVPDGRDCSCDRVFGFP